VSRLTATLQSSGLVRQSGDERFTLGPAALHLGNAYLRTFDFRQQARLHLAELAETAGANVQLGVRDGVDMVVIDTIRPHAAVILSRADIGSRMRIATSAMGRAYCASLPLQERRALLRELREASGKAWPQVSERMDAALAEHAREGWCSSLGEWHPDINALGFTLHGPRGEFFGVSVGGPAFTLTRQVLLEKVAPKLLQVQREIEREAGLA
jgi:DNA-binding IclR family transcriptional regulator